MAQNNNAPDTASVSVTDLAGLIDAVKSTAPIKKVPYSKREPAGPFAEGKTRKQRLKLKYIFYQNGFRVGEKRLFDREIEWINKLEPGKFINNMVTVRKIESGNEEPDSIHLMYKNATIDQRLALNQEVHGLYGMVQRCVQEAETQRQAQRSK